MHSTIELLEKETPELIPPQLWPPNSPGLNPGRPRKRWVYRSAWRAHDSSTVKREEKVAEAHIAYV